MKTTKRKGIVLDEHIAIEVEQLVIQQGTTVSLLINKLLTDYLSKKENPYTKELRKAKTNILLPKQEREKDIAALELLSNNWEEENERHYG